MGTGGPARLPLADGGDPVSQEVLGDFAGRAYRHVNLMHTLANSPEMLKAWCAMAWPLRDEPTVPRDLREIAIMRVAQLKDAPYEWAHHWFMSVACGLPKEKLLAIADWRTSDLFDATERDVLAYTEAVVAGPKVADEIYAPIAAQFTPGEVIELTLTITTYIAIAHFLGVLQIEVEEPVRHELEQA
jgi:4-carboxymuconolactone decarboxylase